MSVFQPALALSCVEAWQGVVTEGDFSLISKRLLVRAAARKGASVLCSLCLDLATALRRLALTEFQGS